MSLTVLINYKVFMQVNKPDRHSGIGSYHHREHEHSKSPEKQLPNPKDFSSNTKQTSAPKEVLIPDELNQTQAKTNSYVASILNFASYALSYGANSSLGKQMVSRGLGLLEISIFSFKEIRISRNQNLQELKKLTGNENLGLFLEQLSVPISKFVISNIEGEFLKAGMQNETEFLQSITKCMTTKMAVNVARHLKSEGKEVTLLSIATCLTILLKAQMTSIQQQLKDAETIEDPVTKEAAIKKATSEAAESFLKLAFPEGEAELPLREIIKSVAWSYLKDTFLPNQFREMASLGNGIEWIAQLPMMDSDAKKISSLAEVSSEVENMIVETGPKLLADKKIADALSKIMLNQLEMKKNKQTDAFETWVSEQIQIFGDVKNAPISDLWNFLGGTTGSIATYLLSNLTKNGDEKEDWKESVVNNVLRIINTFENLHHAEIEEVYKQQLQKGIKPENIKKTPEYIQCFIPLSKMIEDITGFEELEAIFPPKTYGSLEKKVSENLTKNLALGYEDYLRPLSVIYEAMENPKVLRSTELEGTKTQQQIDDTAEMIAGQLSKYLNKEPGKIEKKICENVLENLPSLEEVRNLVNNEKDRIASETTTPLIEKESTLNTWLHDQVKDLLQKVGKNNQNEKTSFWNLFTNGAAGILEHIVIYKKAQSPNDNIENVLAMVVDQFTKCLSDFQHSHGPEIEAQFHALKTKGIKPQENKEFVNSFTPLCVDLLDAFGVKKEGGGILEMAISKLLLKYLPGKLAEYYQETLVIKESTERAEIKLKKVFNEEGGEKNATIVKQLENVCHLISEKMIDVVSENIYDAIIDQIVEEKKNTLDKRGIIISNHRIPSILTKETKELVPLELIKAQNPLIQQQMYSVLMQSLSNYLERLQNDDMSTDKISPEKVLQDIGKTLESRLSADAEAIKKAGLIKDPEKRKLELRKAFTPLTEELITLIAPASLKNEVKIPLEIPFADFVEESWQEVQSQTIPDLLGKMYVSSTTWTSEIEHSKKVLHEQTKADYAAEACRVMAEWTHCFIPASVIREEKDLTHGIYDAAVKYLEQTGNKEGLSVKDFILQNEVEIKQRVAENCFSFFAPDGQAIIATKPMSKEFIEGAYLKIFSNLTVKVSDVQGRTPKEQENFMVNLGINLLNEANKHFGAINEAMNKDKKSSAFEVKHETYIKELREKGVLNAGMQQDIETRKQFKELSKKLEIERRVMMKLDDPVKKDKCLERIIDLKKELKKVKDIQTKERQQFFAPFAKNCMELSGITSPEQIPCPLPPDSPLRQELFIKFQEELLPMVLENIFEQIMDPKARVKMALAGLKSLNEAMDKMPTLNEEQLMKDDPTQRELNRVCGELVLQLVQLVPKSMIKAAFKIEKVQELSAEMVGKSVRNYLGNDLDIMKLLNQGIKEGMDSLHPGTWVKGENGQVAFVGKNETGDLNFSFPLNEMEAELKIQKEMLIADQELKDLRKSMVDTTHRVMSDSFKAFLVAPLIKLKKIWDFCVDAVFRKYGSAVRNALDRTGFKFIYRLLEVAGHIAMLPIKKIFWFFMEIHIGWKADEVIKSLQLDIHDNLFYQLVDTFIASLKKETPIIPSEEILKSADIRDEEERQDVIKILKRFGLLLEDIYKEYGKKTTSP